MQTSKIEDFRRKLERQKGEFQRIQKSIHQGKEKRTWIRKDLRKHEQAREIIREVGLKTQQQLQYHISDITSLALDAVFPDPYELVAEFVQRRNKTECDLYFERDGDRMDPISASGGGAVDVAAFALRIASWSMQNPRSRNTIILDEPMRFLSANLQDRASQMIKQISTKLNIQFIIITHEEALTEHADSIFQVGIKKGRSQIKKISENEDMVK
jgi:DNA repair exonuclease SbcCD ATPase subunit